MCAWASCWCLVLLGILALSTSVTAGGLSNASTQTAGPISQTLNGTTGVANTTAANSTDETAHPGGIDVARVRHGMPAGEKDLRVYRRHKPHLKHRKDGHSRDYNSRVDKHTHKHSLPAHHKHRRFQRSPPAKSSPPDSKDSYKEDPHTHGPPGPGPPPKHTPAPKHSPNDHPPSKDQYHTPQHHPNVYPPSKEPYHTHKHHPDEYPPSVEHYHSPHHGYDHYHGPQDGPTDYDPSRQQYHRQYSEDDSGDSDPYSDDSGPWFWGHYGDEDSSGYSSGEEEEQEEQQRRQQEQQQKQQEQQQKQKEQQQKQKELQEQQQNQQEQQRLEEEQKKQQQEQQQKQKQLEEQRRKQEQEQQRQKQLQEQKERQQQEELRRQRDEQLRHEQQRQEQQRQEQLRQEEQERQRQQQEQQRPQQEQQERQRQEQQRQEQQQQQQQQPRQPPPAEHLPNLEAPEFELPGVWDSKPGTPVPGEGDAKPAPAPQHPSLPQQPPEQQQQQPPAEQLPNLEAPEFELPGAWDSKPGASVPGEGDAKPVPAPLQPSSPQQPPEQQQQPPSEQLPNLEAPEFELPGAWDSKPRAPGEGIADKPSLPDLDTSEFEGLEPWVREDPPKVSPAPEQAPDPKSGSQPGSQLHAKPGEDAQTPDQLPDLASPGFELPGVWDAKTEMPQVDAKAPQHKALEVPAQPEFSGNKNSSQPNKKDGSQPETHQQQPGNSSSTTHPRDGPQPVAKLPGYGAYGDYGGFQGKGKLLEPSQSGHATQPDKQLLPGYGVGYGVPDARNSTRPVKRLPGYGGFGVPEDRLNAEFPDPTGSDYSSSPVSRNSTRPVRRLPGYGGFGVPEDRFNDQYPDPTAGPPKLDDGGNGTQRSNRSGYGYWPSFPPALGDGEEADYAPAPGERRFGDPLPGINETPRVVNGSCKAGGAESNCQGSGVIIDDAARVADGAFTAIADCVEEAGNIYQKGGFCDLVCTDEADYKVVQKSSQTVKTGYDGQVQCEAKRVTDNVTINGICSLIPVATCCEPENPEEGLVFVRTLRDDRRREKQVRGPQYHQ